VAAARRLAGLSGADVFLVSNDGKSWFVRKSARTPAESARLRRQAAKQQRFGAELAGVIRTPAILDEGEVEERFYYDMEFVRGTDGASYLRRASYADVVGLGRRLSDYLEIAAARPPVCPTGAAGLFEALFAKLCEVQRATTAVPGEVLYRLFLALDRLRQIGGLAPTLCHGDMTLENLLIDDHGQVWAVDLLDSPFEHYWQDVAKLHQDLAGGWYLTRQHAIATCVLDYLSRKLRDTARQLQPQYPEVHALLVAGTFVRILPYARTPQQTQFVLERLSHFARLASGEEAPPPDASNGTKP
jgi:aminoglycoside phosphotransferase